MILSTLLFASAVALNAISATADNLVGPSQKLKNTEFCYVPTDSNVSYSDVKKLRIESPNHIVSYGDNPLQFAEIWLPSKAFSAAKPPLVILIHGGCWLNSFDIKHTHALSTGLRHSGYAVWSLEYRRTGDDGGGWPGTFDDVMAGIAQALDSDEQPFDNHNVAVVGHSAGGHLALLAGAKYRNSPQIKAVIGLAAITNINQYAHGNNSCEKVTPEFMGGSPDAIPDAYAAANPAELESHKNTVLLHGNLDTIVAPEHSTYLESANTIPVLGAGHFDMIHPGTQSFQRLLEQLGKQL